MFKERIFTKNRSSSLERKQYLTLRDVATPSSYKENTTLPSLAFYNGTKNSLPGRQDPSGNKQRQIPSSSSRSCYRKRGQWTVWKRKQPTIAGMMMHIISLTLVINRCIFEIYKWRHRGPEKVRNSAKSTTEDRIGSSLRLGRLCRPFSFRIILPHNPNLYVCLSSLVLPTLLCLSPSLSNLFTMCRT